MGTINLYNSIDNTHQVIHGCGKLSELIPESYFENAIILKEGSKLDKNYCVTSDDILFVRRTPKATTTAVAVAVTTAVVVFAGVEIGRAFAFYQDEKTKAMQEKAQKDAKNLAEQIQQLPFIKGAKNKSALGQTVPFVMGDIYHTPYKINEGSYEIINEDLGDKIRYGVGQYYNVVLALGFGNQIIKDVLFGSASLIKNNSGISSGIHKFYINENDDFRSLCEIRQAGEKFTTPEFTKKIICNQDGSELKHEYNENAEPLIRQLPDYAKSVDICIQFNGLRTYNATSSHWEQRTVSVKPYWTNVENPTDADWNEIIFEGSNNNSFTDLTKRTLRFVAHKDFSASESYGKNIQIKVVKTTPKPEGNSNEDCYLLYYQTECFDNAKSTSTNLVTCSQIEEELENKTTRIGFKLLANDNTKDLIDELHCIVSGVARTWNGSEWSTDKSATRNPASWILEILTSNVHHHSKYNDSELDLNSFGRLYEYCERNNFYTDGILTSGMKKRDLVSQILSTVNSDIIKNADGLLEVVTDDKEETPVALLNAENISSITYAKDFSRKADGLKVSFTNRDSWQIDTFYSYIKENHVRTQEDILTEMNLEYVTTHDHAYKIAQRKMRQQALQPKEVKVDVGREGDYYPMYSTVMLQYTTFRIGLNSSVIAGLIKDNQNRIVGVRLADLVQMEAGNNYGLIIQAVTDAGKKTFYKTIKFSLGSTHDLEFNEPIEVTESVQPEIDNNVSFGILDEDNGFTKITDTMKICRIEPNGSNGYTLTLKNYNESMYEYGVIPEFKSNITTPPRPRTEIPNFEIIEGQAGSNGYSAYTIQLFKRYADIPAKPSNTLNYNFMTATLSGDLEGWSQSMPMTDEDNNPLYEIHATISNQNTSVEIKPSDFSEPVIVLKESNITIAEIQEMINKVTPPPTVEADVTFFGIAVDENGICKKTQSVTTEIHVRQTEEELGFDFGEIVLPDGFEYTIDENKIVITCKKDTFVKSGSIIVPVKYRAYKSNIAYVNNEDETQYYISSGNILGNFDKVEDIPTNPQDNSIINWVGETTPMTRSDNDFEKDTAYQYVAGRWNKFNFTPYGYYVYAEDYTVSNIGIGFTQVKGFRYFDSIDSVSDIPEDLVLGDWFTWIGEDTEANIVEGGTFKQCCLYAWNGEKWEIDESTDHNTRAIFDILSLAESKLKQNNSKASTFLDSLCSNKAFIETLVVSGSAFIKQLTSLNIYAEQITVAKNEAIESVESDLGVDSLEDKTIIDGGKVKADLIDTNKLKVGDKLLVDESGTFLNADVINAEEIKSKEGFFDNITSNNGIFNNVVVNGEVNATTGRFSSTVGKTYDIEVEYGQMYEIKIEGDVGYFAISESCAAQKDRYSPFALYDIKTYLFKYCKQYEVTVEGEGIHQWSRSELTKIDTDAPSTLFFGVFIRDDKAFVRIRVTSNNANVLRITELKLI